MQLLVQDCLDPSRATEIFSVPKRRIFALPRKLYATEIKVDYSTSTVLEAASAPRGKIESVRTHSEVIE